jgi:hypothetical protein
VPPARGSEVVEAEQEVLVTDPRRAAGGGHAASSTL